MCEPLSTDSCVFLLGKRSLVSMGETTVELAMRQILAWEELCNRLESKHRC